MSPTLTKIQAQIAEQERWAVELKEMLQSAQKTEEECIWKEAEEKQRKEAEEKAKERGWGEGKKKKRRKKKKC